MPDQEEQWAVFWCSLLSPLLYGEVSPIKVGRFLRDVAQTEHLFPDGTRRRTSQSTLYRKWKRYREGGFEALFRKRRSDRGKPRKATPEMIERAIELKKERPRRSTDDINQFLLEEFHTTIPKSTICRHLKRAGVTRLSMPPSRTAIECQIRTILPREKETLRQWRNSSNKRLWDRGVTILDSSDSTVEEICAKIERSRSSICRWVRAFNEHGIEGIRRKSRDRTKSNQQLELKTKRLFEILHDRPISFGINRSNWTLSSLTTAYEKRHGETISKTTVRRLIRGAGYGMRKARRVLTSPDPHYREKVELLLETLQSLSPTELLFFVDEMGPLRVKSYGGRCYAPKGEAPTYREQTSKGSVTLFGALSATTNQVTWFYGRSKDTEAMIDLVEILFNQYHAKSRLYITWDAASWHGSNVLVSWLDAFNAQTRDIGDGPIIEFVPLPSRSQFLDVIESVFSGMKRAVIHHSDYPSEYEMKSAISTHFVDRNEHFKHNPKRAGKKIWEIDFFKDFRNMRAGDYREW